MHKPILIVLLFKVDFFGLLKDSWTQSSISYFYRITVFLRGAGGFSTSSPPFSYSERKSQLNLTPLSKPSVLAQELPPDIVIEEQTHPSQVYILKPNWDRAMQPQLSFEITLINNYNFVFAVIQRSCSVVCWTPHSCFWRSCALSFQFILIVTLLFLSQFFQCC